MIKKLLQISSEQLCKNIPKSFPIVANDLKEILTKKNGFYAFESALHVFHIGQSDSPDIIEWNASKGWRESYKYLTNGMYFFAEDLFGNQYAFKDDKIIFFDADNGEIKECAENFDSWCSLILEDYDYMTGWSLGHEWQIKNRPLKRGERLFPKIPFVAGGEYGVDNLWVGESVDVMRLRGEIALQLNNLPDGTTVQFQFN